MHAADLEAAVAACAKGVLFWDHTLGAPDLDFAEALLRTPVDVWHGGLSLGTGGLPGLIDFVSPTWMLNRDPPADLEATSWRLSLRACLVRTEVLHQLGGPRLSFHSLDAAGLELGHRYLRRGALVRHVPDLVPEGVPANPPDLLVEDELRFILFRYGKRWARWALARSLLVGYKGRSELVRAWLRVRGQSRPLDPAPYRHSTQESTRPARGARVTVLIPTLERYPYLHKVLDQLRTQTAPPFEVVVVDQTPRDERNLSYTKCFPDLPLTVLEQDEAGQCTARNEGLQRSTGDWILLLDDDIEIDDDLIERHLRTCTRFGSEVSSGVVADERAGPLPLEFQHVQVSSVFPAGNTLVHRRALIRSGLFDLAFNRRQSEDGDLGMRVYLSGALMILDPRTSILHHRAPRGGLRAHKARVITYASSRQKLMHRHIPSVSEIYLARRYFSRRQVREAIWIRVVGTVIGGGPWWRRPLKAGFGLMMLLDTVREVRGRYQQATEWLEQPRRIPPLGEAPAVETGAHRAG